MDSATTYIAIYAAVLSTIAIIWNIRRERVKIKVTAEAGFTELGEKSVNAMTVKAVNLRKRPVTLTKFGIRLPDKGSISFPYTYTHKLPKKIGEGDYIECKISVQELNETFEKHQVSTAQAKKLRAFVTDASGRDYYAKPKLGKLGFL